MKVFGTKSEKRRYQRRLRIKIYCGIGFFILILVGLGYGMIHAPFLKIKDVEARGIVNEERARLEVIGSWRGRLFGPDNFLAWPGSISGMATEKHYGEGKLVLIGQPADRFAIWCASAGSVQASVCVWVNQQGTALESAPDTEGAAIPKINDGRDLTPVMGEPVLTPSQFAALAGILRGMSGMPITIKSYMFNNKLEELVAAPMTGGRLVFSVRFIPNEKLFASLKNLIVSGQVKKAEYVDFTVENRIYVK